MERITEPLDNLVTPLTVLSFCRADNPDRYNMLPARLAWGYLARAAPIFSQKIDSLVSEGLMR